MKPLKLETNGIALIGEATDAPTDFLLLHAGGETRRVWRPVIEGLSVYGFGAAAYDQRGHGQSGGAEKDGLRAFGWDAGRMLEAHSEATIVVGGSLGGMAALLAVVGESQQPQAQDRLAGLVLVDVAPAPDPVEARRYLAGQGERVASSPLVDNVLEEAELLSEAASRLKLPVMLVRAGRAAPLRDAQVREFRALCPQLTVVRIANASHLVARDAPIALAEHLAMFAQSPAVRRRRLSRLG